MQVFRVRLKNVGANRLRVLTRIAELTSLRPGECRQLADAGGLIIADEMSRDRAIDLAHEFRQMGAEAEVELSYSECSDDCCE